MKVLNGRLHLERDELLEAAVDHGWQHAQISGLSGIFRIVIFSRHSVTLRMGGGRMMKVPTSRITDLHRTRVVA